MSRGGSGKRNEQGRIGTSNIYIFLMINHYLFIFFQQGLLPTVTKQRGGN